MGFFSKIAGEFIDIIEWLDDSNNTLIYRFKRYDNEIKNGAKLIVREGQRAIFVDKGQIADHFQPGDYELTTDNLPVLSTLKGWKHGFSSPFKAEVYFVSTRQLTDLKWGTPNPILIRDREFGPVRLRAFGNYAIKVEDDIKFLREIVGTDGHFEVEEIENQLRAIVINQFSDTIAESKIPVLDMATQYQELSKMINESLKERFDEYGLTVRNFLIHNISLPDEVEEAIDKRASMGAIGNMNAFNQYQTGISIEDAANNPNGGRGLTDGLGMGMGMGMANNMMNQNNNNNNTSNQGPSGPPPVPAQVKFYFVINGNQSSAMTSDMVKTSIEQGEITRETLAWKEGMSDWKPAENIPEIKGMFGSVPPPIPG